MPRSWHRFLPAAVMFMALLSGIFISSADASTSADEALPRLLSDTGLFEPGSSTDVRGDVLAFSPQYPLWSDHADKRRWLWLPAGSFIDGSDPDRWAFPPGTKLWKEFSHAGRRVETRFITRGADGAWRYATYVWREDGRDATLAPDGGIAALRVAQAPGGSYAVPSRTDCLVCHESAAVPVLGAGALQLSPDRDPNAAHGAPLSASEVTLRELAALGVLRGVPASLLERSPPRIPAGSATERAALGYLHGNCGHCHNDNGSPAPVALLLSQRVADAGATRDRVLRSMIDAPSRYRPPGLPGEARQIVPGRPHASVLSVRMGSRHPQVQMPPLGTALRDPEGMALIERWIANDLANRKEARP